MSNEIDATDRSIPPDNWTCDPGDDILSQDGIISWLKCSAADILTDDGVRYGIKWTAAYLAECVLRRQTFDALNPGNSERWRRVEENERLRVACEFEAANPRLQEKQWSVENALHNRLRKEVQGK